VGSGVAVGSGVGSGGVLAAGESEGDGSAASVPIGATREKTRSATWRPIRKRHTRRDRAVDETDVDETDEDMPRLPAPGGKRRR
jgi:hypothetical protein